MEDLIENFICDGYGYGDGSGDGDRIESVVPTYCGRKVYCIDGIPTIIYHVHDNFAKCAILKRDLTLSPCWVAKQDGYFAHGSSIHEAQSALMEKIFENMTEEDRIKAFIDVYSTTDTVAANEDLFEWHHNLTGSCEMGRRQFAEEHDIDLSGNMTVAEFIELTKNAYGGEVIRHLNAAYDKGE